MYPNKIVKTLGQHEEEEHFPIGSLSLSNCGRIVASSSHDSSIKFYDVGGFVKSRDGKIEEGKEEEI